jgi:hypothetical protein
LFFKLLGDSKTADPDPIPGHLSALVSDVLRLDVLKEAGATFAYPDSLTPLQWSGLEALTNARRRYQAKDPNPQKNEPASQQTQAQRQATAAHLAQLSHGR